MVLRQRVLADLEGWAAEEECFDSEYETTDRMFLRVEEGKEARHCAVSRGRRSASGLRREM